VDLLAPQGQREPRKQERKAKGKANPRARTLKERNNTHTSKKGKTKKGSGILYRKTGIMRTWTGKDKEFET
jgi:hypothetical protein